MSHKCYNALDIKKKIRNKPFQETFWLFPVWSKYPWSEYGCIALEILSCHLLKVEGDHRHQSQSYGGNQGSTLTFHSPQHSSSIISSRF